MASHIIYPADSLYSVFETLDEKWLDVCLCAEIQVILFPVRSISSVHPECHIKWVRLETTTRGCPGYVSLAIFRRPPAPS